jgi:hypothetical protein
MCNRFRSIKGVTYVVRANMGADITVNRNFAAHSPGSAR